MSFVTIAARAVLWAQFNRAVERHINASAGRIYWRG